MAANYLDENGKEQPLVMGCYGIGINRTVAAIIEQHNDENGIVWPMEIAPYKVVVMAANMKNQRQVEKAEEIYEALKKESIDAILDDRNERVGVKFKDADLIGIPIRITVGKRIDENIVEFKLRSKTECDEIELSELLGKVNISIKEGLMK